MFRNKVLLPSFGNNPLFLFVISTKMRILLPFALTALAIVLTSQNSQSNSQARPQQITLDQAAVEVSALLKDIKQTPAPIAPAMARRIEDIVNRVDWNKMQLNKGAKLLAEPTVNPETKLPNIIWEAYALVYAAQDAKMKRPQMMDTMLCNLWPVESAAKLASLKKAIDANRVKSGANAGSIKSPVAWMNITVTTNEELKSSNWPWIRDSLSGKLTLAPIYIEEMSKPTPPPSSKVYFEWWNGRETDGE